MNWKQEIGRRIREQREQKGWTLQELADHTESLTVSHIGNYEQGTRKPDENATRQLASALSVSAGYLAGYSAQPYDSSALSPDEKALIEKYRQTNEQGRKSIHSVAESQPAYGPGVDDDDQRNAS